jgi:ribonuclease P protein component
VVIPAGEQGLPRRRRLLRPVEFARVYGRRATAAAGPLVLYAAPREDDSIEVRLGLSVSRRIGNAVVRNRWKRRLREAFRRVRPRLPAGQDYIVVVRSGEPPAGGVGARRVEESLVELATRVTGRPGYAARGSASQPARGRGRGKGG